MTLATLPFSMNEVTIAWIGLPFFLGFTIFLLPQLDRLLCLLGAVASGCYATALFQSAPVVLQLLDHYGNTLRVDTLSAYFILTNALVTIAVLLYCWRSQKSPFFFGQMILLHGSLNAAFASSDLISVYVALEVSGIAAFLLIAYPRSDRSLWVALRYLFVSNIAMLFYLIGAVLAYQVNQTFSFDALRNAPPEAIALILMGLMVKGGVFISGLWLPLTHSESETPVSALLSGVVVKAGVYPLLRFAILIEELNPIVRFFGVCTALLGVTYAMFEKDTKRMLAFHTVSQLGFVLAAPAVGGFYALTHGLVKSSLFLTAGNLPSRSFKELKNPDEKSAIATPLWILLVAASLSISGLPLLAGFAAKTLTLKELLPWQTIALNVAAVGTAVSFAKFIFLPHHPASLAPKSSGLSVGYLSAMAVLLGGLLIANAGYVQAYSLESMAKAIATIAIGWLIYHFVIRQVSLKLPRLLEQFEQLLGMMTLILIALFWMVLA